MNKGEMNNGELIASSIVEFSRLQGFMKLCEKESEVYKAMKIRYLELKAILNSLSVNLSELDIIKE